MEKEKEKSKELSKKTEEILKSIEGLTVLELSQLVHAMEDTFGIQAQAPVAVAAGGAAPATAIGTWAEMPNFSSRAVTRCDNSNTVKASIDLRISSAFLESSFVFSFFDCTATSSIG